MTHQHYVYLQQFNTMVSLCRIPQNFYFSEQTAPHETITAT